MALAAIGAMDELTAAAAVLEVTTDAGFEGGVAPEPPVDTQPATEVLQSVDGNTSTRITPNSLSPHPTSARGPRSLHHFSSPPTSFGRGRARRYKIQWENGPS